MATDGRPIDPYPDALYGADAGSLARVAALQRLAPRGRAVVALTELAGFAPAEVAEMLGADLTWVEHAARRARAAGRGQRLHPRIDPVTERRLVARLQAALERVDAEAVAHLLDDEVALTCTRRWAVIHGVARVAAILCERMTDERLRLLPTRANGQPAFGCYVEADGASAADARGMLAITLAGDRVDTLTRFWDNDVLPYFGLPETLPAR